MIHERKDRLIKNAYFKYPSMSRHRGYHSTYNEFVKTQLDAMDISQGATVDLWQRSLERIQ